MAAATQSVTDSAAAVFASQACVQVAATAIEARLRRLVVLQGDVLADQDPEPLHQMRVSFRRLRSTLEQFAPALRLPDGVEPRRIARIGRRLGLTRDLDVLRQRLEEQLVPLLADREREQLRPLFKQLRRERRLAFEELAETLQGRRYLKLLAQLQRWCRQPQATALGGQPLQDWRPELVQAVLQGLMGLPGWWAQSAYDTEAVADLHTLRRRIKRARYGLANLEPLEPERLGPWVERFRRMQELLGDLNDLQLLQAALDRQLDGRPDQLLPGLCSLLAEQRDQAWQDWRCLVEAQQQAEWRRQVHGLALPVSA